MDPPRTAPGSSGSMFGLMEGPILEGTGDPEKKKQHFILDEIDQHLEDLHVERGHSLAQGLYFTIMFLCCVIGATMIVIGLSLTVIFQQLPNNFVLVGIGAGMCHFKYHTISTTVVYM